MGRLKDYRAIVTGAADGMGEAIAQLFAAEGARVLAVDIQAERLEAAHQGKDAITVMAQDIAAPGAAEAIVAEAEKAFGGVDILVNNAGVRGSVGPIYRTDDDAWRHVMSVNLDAAFRLCRAVTPFVTKSANGRIINVASIQGMLAAPTIGPYVTSKHGVLGLTRAFALDLGRKGVTVNCIMPGFVETGMTRGVQEHAPEIWDRMIAKLVIGRPGKPIEIAHMALFLASAESSFVTGACIPVDGGMSCWS